MGFFFFGLTLATAKTASGLRELQGKSGCQEHVSGEGGLD